MEFGDIITLDNKIDYVVASVCTFENNFYAYLVNIQNEKDCLIGFVQDDDFIQIKNEETFIKLMPLFLDNINPSIFEEGDNNE